MLKLKQEEFDKLSQLDRIEFRQKIENLEKSKMNYLPFLFLKSILLAIGFIILLGTSMYGTFPIEGVIKIFQLIPKILLIGIIIIIFLLIFDSINSIRFKKREKELYDAYFKFEVNPKKYGKEKRKNKDL